MAYTPTACVIVVSLGLGMAWVFISLRTLVRVKMVKVTHWDDILAFAATVRNTLTVSVYLDGVINNGIGEHMSPAIPFQVASQGLKMFFIAELMFAIGTALIKLSFVLTLRRIVLSRIHHYALTVVVAVTLIVSIVSFCTILFACQPIDAFWTASLNPTTAMCGSTQTQIRMSYAHGFMMLFVDILVGIVIPVHLLIILKMDGRSKILAGLLLSLGSVASIATIARVSYTATLAANPDLLYAINIPFFWGQIELATCIICTSATTLRPLIKASKRFNMSSQANKNSYRLEGIQSIPSVSEVLGGSPVEMLSDDPSTSGEDLIIRDVPK